MTWTIFILILILVAILTHSIWLVGLAAVVLVATAFVYASHRFHKDFRELGRAAARAGEEQMRLDRLQAERENAIWDTERETVRKREKAWADKAAAEAKEREAQPLPGYSWWADYELEQWARDNAWRYRK